MDPLVALNAFLLPVSLLEALPSGASGRAERKQPMPERWHCVRKTLREGRGSLCTPIKRRDPGEGSATIPPMRSLFDDQEPPREDPGARREEMLPAASPLAERIRPRSLEEVVGHQKLLGPEGFLRRAIAAETSSHFVPFSAVTSGIKEVKEVMAEAVRLRRAQGRRTLLFVDEIHRFNRAQQDAFLPYVERGDVVLVGATTENPSFEL